MKRNQSQNKPTISITGIFVQDPDDKGYTGFFSEIPEAVAEGDTIEDAVQNLLSTLPTVLHLKSKILEEEKAIDGASESLIKRSFEFQLQ